MGALGKLDVRVGVVSSIDYDKGMVEVTYPDMDDMVTQPLPLLTPFADEYFMPEVDDQIIVLHLSNGAEYGVVLGWQWDEEHPPHETGKGIYRKDFDREWGKSFIKYDAGSGTMTLTLPQKLVIVAPGEIELKTAKVDVPEGHVVNQGVCLLHHTHNETQTVTLTPNPTC